MTLCLIVDIVQEERGAETIVSFAITAPCLAEADAW